MPAQFLIDSDDCVLCYARIRDLTNPQHPLNFQSEGQTLTTGGQKLSMRIIRRLQHGPRTALQIRLQG